MIRVTDIKGDEWELITPIEYNYTTSGTYELWFSVITSPFPGYQMIPVPVFTDWWPNEIKGLVHHG